MQVGVAFLKEYSIRGGYPGVPRAAAIGYVSGDDGIQCFYGKTRLRE